MLLQPNEFFPDHATWPFIEYATGATLSIDLKSRVDGAQRLLEWTAPPEHRFRAFFDRMTITPAGLELNRVRMYSQTLDIRPPLVITTGDQRDHVADLFPKIEGILGTSTKPYDGTVIFKHVQEIPKPGSPKPDLLWSVGIESRGQDRAKVFRALFQFTRSAGLIEYTGDVYGVFFVYRRTDLPGYIPPPAVHPQPMPAPQPPQPHSTRPGVPPSLLPPHQDYHTRIAKEVWDAMYDDPLLKRLKARGKDEPELALILVKHDLVKPDDGLVQNLRDRAKNDADLAELLSKHNLLKKD